MHQFLKTAAILAPLTIVSLGSPLTIVSLGSEMNISTNAKVKFVPGPMPAASQAPEVDPEYSGLLECPMTTRIAKAIDGAYTVQTQGACGEKVETFQECFHAAASTLGGPGTGRSFKNSTGSDPARPAGCLATISPDDPLTVEVFFNRLASAHAGCGTGAQTASGAADTLTQVHVAVNLDAATDSAHISLSGPSAVWFSAGFGASDMDGAYAIVVDGTGQVTERKLGNHLAGQQLKGSVTVVKSSVTDGVRSVTLSRPLQGATTDYFSFGLNDTSVKIISAVGSGPDLSYHKNKALSSLALLPASGTAGACVCPEAPKPFGQASGALVYHAVADQPADTGAGQVGFGAGKCAQYPSTTMIPDRNPTCDIRHYVTCPGSMTCLYLNSECVCVCLCVCVCACLTYFHVVRSR